MYQSPKHFMNTHYTILLCEDEEFVARSYKRRLELEGFTVIHANNGKEAFEMLTAKLPDLVILDLMMPLMTGFEVLEERAQPKNAALAKIPVIVASNLGQKSDIAEAKRLGANDYVIKSNLSLKDFIACVKRNLPQSSGKK